MRKRRKPVVNWLPQVEVQPNPQDGLLRAAGFTWALDVRADPTGVGSGFNTAFAALTLDAPGEQRLNSLLAGNIVPSLREYIQGSSYRLRRVVGKITGNHISIPPDAGVTTPPSCLLGAGIIVLKVDPDSGDPLESNTNDYSPIVAKNVEDPWIWRRTWILGSGSTGDGSATDRAFSFTPDTTKDFGSAVDGPHIDQKTARIVGPDERLFLVLSTKAVPLLTVYQANSLVVGYFDYRLLATLKASAASNRRRASR